MVSEGDRMNDDDIGLAGLALFTLLSTLAIGAAAGYVVGLETGRAEVRAVYERDLDELEDGLARCEARLTVVEARRFQCGRVVRAVCGGGS